MISRDNLKKEIDLLPDEALDDVRRYIMLQKFYYENVDKLSESDAAFNENDWKRIKSISNKRL